MTEELRRKRIGDAETLLKSVASLKSVPDTERQIFLHDRIISVIESLCARDEGKQPFTKAQVEILKDVAYQILYIVDTKLENRPSLAKRCYLEWREYTILTKIKFFGGLFTAIFLSGAAISEDIRKAVGVSAIYDRMFKPHAANSPSPSAAPGAIGQPKQP